jgi:DNA-binding NtrC family response regulator
MPRHQKEIFRGIPEMERSSSPTAVAINGSVLSVSPIAEDHFALEQLLSDTRWPAPATAPAQLSRTATLTAALVALRRAEYAVAICERDLGDATWKDLLECTRQLMNPPLLIVTSRLADEYLWAEALNLGAHDVLAKPFEPEEVMRVVGLACLRWQRERQPQSPSGRQRSATNGSRRLISSNACGWTVGCAD